MNQKNKYLLSILAVSLFSYASSSGMLTSVFKPAIKNIAKEQDPEITRIKQLATIADVNHEIDIIKDNIYGECLTELSSLTNKPYDYLQQEMDQKRAFIKEELRKNSHTSQNHDQNIPSPMYQQLKKIMVEKQINPKNIDLEYETSSDKPGLLASANSGVYQFFIKPYIKIYSGLSKHSNDSQNFIYHHELQHILLEHPSTNRTIPLYNASYDPSQKTKLISIQEREANIHAASANINNARMGMEKSCFFSHPEIINQKEHCTEMVIMYKLMKQKEKLSKEASNC